MSQYTSYSNNILLTFNYYRVFICQQEPAWHQHDCNLQKGMENAIAITKVYYYYFFYFSNFSNAQSQSVTVVGVRSLF